MCYHNVEITAIETLVSHSQISTLSKELSFSISTLNFSKNSALQRTSCASAPRSGSKGILKLLCIDHSLQKKLIKKNRISRSRSGLGGSGPFGGWPWGPKRSVEAKKSEKKKFRKNRISRIQIRISGSTPRLRDRGGQGLPVAKISDL